MRPVARLVGGGAFRNRVLETPLITLDAHMIHQIEAHTQDYLPIKLEGI